MPDIMKNKKIVVATLIFFACMLLLAKHQVFFTWTDLHQWKNDYTNAIKCLDNKTLPCSSISYLSSAYLLNSAGIRLLSGNGILQPENVTYINLIFLLLPIICFANTSRTLESLTRKTIAYGSAIAISATSGFYVHSGALELQTGVVWGMFLLAFYFGTSAKNKSLNTAIWMTSLFLFLLYKDTNIAVALATFVFSVLYYLAVPRHALQLEDQFKTKAIRFAMIIALGLICMLSFNYVRYGGLLPEAYSKLAKQTSPSALKSGEFLLASLFSPNGGFVVFWAFPIALGIWASSKKFYLHTRDALSIALFAALVSACGLSLWWAPFGWDAFGDRLILPMGIGATIVTIGSTQPLRRRPAATALPIGIKWSLAFIVLISFCYSATIHTQKKPALWSKSLFEGPMCQAMIKAMRTYEYSDSIGSFWKSQRYYDCARERFTHIPGLTNYARHSN